VAASKTRTTLTQEQISKDEIDLIIGTIETVCKMLLALIGILKGMKGRIK